MACANVRYSRLSEWTSLTSTTDNFEDYWRVASKITPTATPNMPPVSGMPPSSQSTLYRPQSVEPGAHASSTNASNAGTISGAPSGLTADGAYSVRNIPVKVFLPDGGPVIQEPIPPMDETGRPSTLGAVLSKHLPLLFPLPDIEAPQSRAFALVQGVLPPSDTEMAWLGACMAGADGWVNVCIGLRNSASGLGLSGL